MMRDKILQTSATFNVVRQTQFCRGTLWQRQGPTILIALALPLILADQIRHVLQGARHSPILSSVLS
jgi:hypothetical protein